MHRKLLITSMYEQCKVESTKKRMWEVIAWSLAALWRGVHPECDWDGHQWPASSSEANLAMTRTSLAGDHFGVLWSIKGDLDWYAKALALPSYNSNRPCPYCPCDKTAGARMHPLAFNRGAAWMGMVYSPQQWRSKNPGMHVLFKTFSFLSCHNVEADELHVLHLGVGQYFLGSVLWLLTFRVMPDDPCKNLAKVWASILAQYRTLQVPTQLTNLTISTITDPKKPMLVYPRLKAEGPEVKHLTAPILDAWLKFCRAQPGVGPYFDKVVVCLQSMITMQDNIDAHAGDMHMTSAAHGRLMEATCKFLVAYTWLGSRADECGDLLFTAAPKLHWLWHMADRAKFLSPRKAACFVDEDLMKHLKRLAARTTPGTQAHKVPLTMFEKYRWAVSLQSQ